MQQTQPDHQRSVCHTSVGVIIPHTAKLYADSDHRYADGKRHEHSEEEPRSLKKWLDVARFVDERHDEYDHDKSSVDHLTPVNQIWEYGIGEIPRCWWSKRAKGQKEVSSCMNLDYPSMFGLEHTHRGESNPCFLQRVRK